MVAEQPRLPPGSASPRARLRWLLIVVAVMALLTAGWPLLNAAVADNQNLAAGSIRIGPGGRNSADIRIGAGWTLRPAQSDPRQDYVLHRGAVAVSIGYVSLADAEQTAGAWSGLRRVFRVTNPGVRLGRPSAVTNGQGLPGLSAIATGARVSGTVTDFVGPSGAYAIRIVVLAPRDAKLLTAATSLLLIRALRFPAASR
ncbi:MAG TPA: hypothetical protein VMA72_00655 [Streptosporangiaceae bacterium]|nr:hypothetical protein [Streptosporangiaceae bacterium]